MHLQLALFLASLQEPAVAFLPGTTSQESAGVACFEQRIDFHAAELENPEGYERVLLSKEWHFPEAQGFRVRFGDCVLAAGSEPDTSSRILVESPEDGTQQFLDATEMHSWRNSSAYFNGSTIRISVLGAPRSVANAILVQSSLVLTGPVPSRGAAAACSPDTRLPTDDPRVARLIYMRPGVLRFGTAFLIHDWNHGFLSAGHLFAHPSSFSSVVEFNVPRAFTSGMRRLAAPEDQYVIDQASMQLDPISAQGGGTGIWANDWAYFGCFPRSSGTTAFDRQGACFELAPHAPAPAPGAGTPVKLIGYGDANGLAPEWSNVQKSVLGVLRERNRSNALLPWLRADAVSIVGDSGGPMLDPSTGWVIGITTAGKCSSHSQAIATAIHCFGLQEALRSPRGVLRPAVWPPPPSFSGLSALAGNGLSASIGDVSHFGQFLVGGGADFGGSGAFRWHRATGTQWLTTSPSDFAWTVAYDGITVAGAGPGEAFRWTDESGAQSLADLPGGAAEGVAYGSADAGTVFCGVGESAPGEREGVAWGLPGLIPVALADIAGGPVNSVAYDVSPPAKMFVGTGQDDLGTRALTWSLPNLSPNPLAHPPGNRKTSSAYACSTDGRWIVGALGDSNAVQGILWDRGTPIPFGDLNGGRDWNYPTDLSADGTRVVGTGESAIGPEAYLFDLAAGGSFRTIASLVGSASAGWQLTDATAISGDGNVIVGYGIAPTGSSEYWVADLLPLTEKTSLPPSPKLSIAAFCSVGAPLSISWTRGTPNNMVRIFYASTPGSSPVPSGSCAGLVTGLDFGSGYRETFGSTNAQGAGSFHLLQPPPVCTGYVQLLDMASCELSEVVSIQ